MESPLDNVLFHFSLLLFFGSWPSTNATCVGFNSLPLDVESSCILDLAKCHSEKYKLGENLMGI
jgi:hypothetical protein